MIKEILKLRENQKFLASGIFSDGRAGLALMRIYFEFVLRLQVFVHASELIFTNYC